MVHLSRKYLTFLIAFTCVLGFSVTSASAQDAKPITAKAAGQIVQVAPCGALICQDTVVAGTASRLGAFTGQLHEAVDTTSGVYSGNATFNFSTGAISTNYTGISSAPDANGIVFFEELHTISGATGKLSGTTGTLHVLGTANVVTGVVQITGTGLISK